VAGLFCSWGKESRASKREVRACGGGLKASHELAEGTSVAVIMIGNLLFTQRIPRPAKILPRDSSGRSIMAATLPDPQDERRSGRGATHFATRRLLKGRSCHWSGR
jgi:hypothetical protein